MKDIITNYWVGFLLAGIGALVIYWTKHYWGLVKKDVDEKFKTKIDENNKVLREELRKEVDRSETSDKNLHCEVEALSTSVENLTAGILSIQGKAFKEDCRRLLRDGYVITMEDYEDIEAEHEAYNGLGGNHKGDALYKSVMKKWNAQITAAGHEIKEGE